MADIKFKSVPIRRELVFTGEITVNPGEGLPEDIEKNYYLEKIKYYKNYQESLPSANSSVTTKFSIKSLHCEEKVRDEIKNAETGLKNMGFNSNGSQLIKRSERSLLTRVRRNQRVHPATQPALHSTPRQSGNNKCVSKSKISYKDVELTYSPNLDELKVIFKDENTLYIQLRRYAKSLPLINFFNYTSQAQRYEKSAFKSIISVKKNKDKYRDHSDGSDGFPVELILANLIYYLSKKLSPGSEKFNILVERTSNPELGDCFSKEPSYYEILGFTNTTETREAVTWTGFTQVDIIKRINAIFTSKLNDTDRVRLILLWKDWHSTYGRKKNKRGSKNGKKINGSPRKRKRSNKKPKK